LIIAFLGGRGVAQVVPAEEVVVWGETRLDTRLHHESFTQVDAGEFDMVAMRADGTAVCWGMTTEVPPLPPGMTYLKVSAGGSLGSVALRSDGEIVSWGSQPMTLPSPPPGLTYVDVNQTGFGTILTLRSDGAVAGFRGLTQYNAPLLPRGVSYVRVGKGWSFWNLAEVRSDGNLEEWRDNSFGQ
jgi:hypothetical protein